MHSQAREIETPSSPQDRKRVLGVIVLTDNRQHAPNDKIAPNTFRCSAFRCTPPLMQRLK